MNFVCKKCEYSTTRKNDYNKHLKTKKHLNKNKIFECDCGKIYKYRSGLWRHKKKCGISNKIQKMKNEIIELKQDNKTIKDNTNDILEVIKQSSNNNTDLINEMKKLKESQKFSKNIITNNQINNNQINNTQNISINVFLNEHCKNAMNLTDFVDKLQITFEDLLHTEETNYVEGISKILIKNLNKLNKLERPIHCSDVKRKVIYIKNKEGWEKDKEHEKITKCIKEVELKQIKKIPEWTKEEKIDIYKNDNNGMKYQKLIFNSMGGMNFIKREKNKQNIIKNISKKTNFKF
tara:strand:+ start:85 stop:960 length:876 start_codon:yes stop_codon:yes gene_type:complete